MKFISNFKKVLFLSIFVFVGLVAFKVSAFEQLNNEKLNDVMDVGTEIYVQHDSSNDDIYLLTSEGEKTIVYEVLNVTYTASKQWTRDGLYIDDSTGKIGATSPEDYISVKENEVYFVRLYGISDIYRGVNGDEWHITSPIVYFDDAGNCVGYDLSGALSSSKSGVEITIPAGATRMYISNYNNQNISIQKKLILNEEEFNQIKNKQDEILNYVDTNYEDVKNDPIVYSELDKGYITFVNDDTKPNVDKFADLFISKGVPLCYAAVADNLLNTASNLTETRLEVALRVQEAGGEILAHNAPVVTENTINDTNFMYKYFTVQKQALTRMGLNVNGIILAGGSGQITGSPITAKWTSAIYKYSDLLGEEYSTTLGNDSVYYHYRTGLGNYQNDIEKIKADIDKAIEEKTWKIFYFHDTNEVSLETLEEIINYINSKSSEDVEVVTYNTMYQKFAKRESTIKNEKKVYYVSSEGTSKDGTDRNDPTNLETLKNKKIKTGDTILFKSGDTFFGTLDLTISSVNDEYVTISNYGEGDLPTISTYKYINDAWEKYSDTIYRINIKDVNNYTGYTSESTAAFNVGFLEDDKGNKYYNKKVSIDALTSKFDFYSDGSEYLYMYINENPYEVLGNLKVVVRSNLMTVSSNMKISNIRFSYTGGHAIEGAYGDKENIVISNCIIENIGGSYLYSSSLTSDTRYGNGIEFYGSNAKDIVVTNNIFRNIYDVAFTIQGTSGSGTNIYVHDNVFINNSQDSEIWESGSATGVYNYKFYNNLSINQGRGWGYEARADKYPAASILFWGYEIENTDISFMNNVFYNPRQIYYLSVATNKYFLTHDTIQSDNNTYYMASDTTIYRNNWNYDTREDFIATYQVDKNSTYHSIQENPFITEQANYLNDINKIRLLVLNKEDVIKSIELGNLSNTLILKKGDSIRLDDYYLKINYFDGLSDSINLDSSMLSTIDYNKIGTQTITISYLGYKTTFNIEIVEEIKEQEEITNNEKETITEVEEDTNVVEIETNLTQKETIPVIDNSREESAKDTEDVVEEIQEETNITNVTPIVPEEVIKENSDLKYIIGMILSLITCLISSIALYKNIKNK